jgi:TonB family protein
MIKKISCLVFTLIIFTLPAYCLFEKDNYVDEPLVNNVFYETDIRQALQDISAQVKIPIVIESDVQGFVNIELTNVALDDALEMLLVPLGYAFKRIDEYYIVGLANPSSPIFNLLAKTEVVSLDYVKAENITDLVSDFFLPYLKANKHNNSVTITAPQNIIERFKDDIIKIDQPRQQVMMEALVVEVSEAGKKELGIRWGSMQEGGFSVSPPSSFSYENFVGAAIADNFEFSGTVTQSTLLTLKTMIQKGTATVRANPRISALNGEEANIFVGREEFFLINTGSQAYPYNSLQSIDTGVTLKVVPSVSSSGAITVKIQPEVSEVIGTGTTNLPIVNRRTVSTTVRVFDGDTIVIGGLIQHNSSQTDTRAPVLGKIPILGNLFKNKDVASEDKEVIIFITPHLSDIDSMFSQVDASRIKSKSKAFFKRNSYADRRAQNTHYNTYSSNAAGGDDYLIRKYSSYVNDVINTTDLQALLASLYDRDVINSTVIAHITVSRTGYIERINITRSSGSELIDATIAEAIRTSSPLPKLPQGLRSNNVTLRMAFNLG